MEEWMYRVLLSVEINMSQFPSFMFDYVELISLYPTLPSFCSPSHHSSFFPFSLSPSSSFFPFSLPFSLSSFLPFFLLSFLLSISSTIMPEMEDESGGTLCYFQLYIEQTLLRISQSHLAVYFEKIETIAI